MAEWLMWLLAALAGAAAVTAFVSRRWVWWAVLLYLASPLILFIGVMLWEAVARPRTEGVVGLAILGLAILSPILALPWLMTCILGFAIGLVPRRWIRPPLAPVAPVAQTATVPAADWRPIHVGLENDAVAIAGAGLWKQPWRPAGLPPVSLPHPAHPHQTHMFEIYDVGANFASHRFAAAELSNGVWGFYVPGSAAVAEEETLSDDGSLRYVRQRRGPPHFNASAVTLSDVATGAVYFDGAGYEDARIFEQIDGTLTLRVTEHQLAGVIHIYPREKVFRLSGSGAPGRPLSLLQGAVSEALLANTGAAVTSEAASPKRAVPLFTMVALALAAIIAIGVVSYLTEPRRSAVQITPMPAMPPIPGNSGPKR